MLLRRGATLFVVVVCLGGVTASGRAQPADVAELYTRLATWQETWQAATEALADLEAEEAGERAGMSAPGGIELGPWHMIGSFSNEGGKGFDHPYPPEQETDYAKVYQGMGDSEARWQKGSKLIDGQVINLHQHFKITEQAIAYLHRVIRAEKAVEAPLYLGSDDGIAVFLNGERILARDVPRGPAPDQDVVNAKLKAGENDLLLKIVNRTGGWGYYFSVKPYAGKDGEPPEHGRRVNQLWNLVRGDFSDERFQLEMRWETADGIWEKHGSPVSDDVLQSRYEQAATSRLEDAKESVAWIAADDAERSADGLQEAVEALIARAGAAGEPIAARRAAYHDTRLVLHVLEGQYRISCAGLAVNDLATTYPSEYAQADEFHAHLVGLFRQGEKLLSAEVPLTDLAAWDDAIARLQQQALVEANPLLAFDKLLFIRRKGHHGLPQNWHGNSSLRRTGYETAICTLSPVRAGGTVSEVTAKQGPFVGDIDLHVDGDRFLFSMAGDEPPHTYNVFEMRVDGTGLRQVTTSPYPDFDNYDGCYLPNGDIIFVSTRNIQGVPCTGPDHVGLLYRCDSQGRYVRQLTFDQDHSWHPTMLPDGRVLYSRWEYNDTPHYFSRILFAMNPDGTEQMAYYASNSYFPNAIFYSTPIPGSATRVVSIVSGHHGNPRMGEVAIIDCAQGFRGAEGVVQILPQRHRKVEEAIIDQYATGQWPQFLMPHPLSGKYFLVSCQPDASSPWGIYLVDVFDNLVPILVEPGVHLMEPVPLRPGPPPRVLPDRVDYSRNDALVRLEDIYRGPGLKGVPRGTIRKLRIVEPIYRYWGNGDQYGISMDGTWDVKRIYGTVPVYADGSALFRVPANTPLAVQPLDENNMAQQHMRSWFTAMPGEVLACVGCHEPRQDTAPTATTEALRHQASEITPWYGPARPFSFETEVQPLLDEHCVGCHNGEHRLDLRGRAVAPEAKYSPAYNSLHPYVRRPGLESDIHLLPPREFVASTSQLVQLLRKGHNNVTLDEEGWDRLITWIDLNVPYYDSWATTHSKPAPEDLVKRREEMRAADAEARAALAAGRGG